MSELISGKEAKLAWANGKKLQIANMIVGEDFYDMNDSNTMLNIFDLDFYQFRLKPRTITINGIELAPCYAVGIDHTKNEVSIQFHNNEDAVKLNNLLLNIYGCDLRTISHISHV